MHLPRTIPLLAVLVAHVARADDDYYRQQQQQELYRQQQQQELYRQQQQQELYRQQQQQQELYRQQQQQQELYRQQQQQELYRQQERQRLERDTLERQRVERARLDEQREYETHRRRQERDEDERRDENHARQQQERNEAFERQETLRRRQLEWARQLAVTPTAPAPRTCRVVAFKTVSAAEGMNYSSAASNEVVSYATIIGDFGAGLVGFTVRGNNEGQLASRFESSPTTRLVDLHYAESCRRSGDDDYLCERVFRAVRGAVDFDALTTPTAPRGRLIARVRSTTLVEWNVAQRKPVPGGDCVTLVNFDFESTFLPK
ncbi:MAG: hypothetical protein JNJ54_20145 [Myxococcaceae bacterium]|nr:hypothetical protein [Myxococcaceae bacterium]